MCFGVFSAKVYKMARLLATVVCVVLLVSAVLAKHDPLYEARSGSCDWFVAETGDDDNDGHSLDAPLKNLRCLLDPNACADSSNYAEAGDVVCLLSGRYPVDETMYARLPLDSRLTIRNIGDDRTAVLDGLGKTQIFNALQTNVLFQGISFENGQGTSGAAVYGERDLGFENCRFFNNHATVHAGAVMSTRFSKFVNCQFEGNSARFAGAVRVSDIGSATMDKCSFIANSAISRGGAIITQIEKPDEQHVKISDSVFCFNEAEISPNIFNFRTTTHDCVHCRFDPPACCSGHGRVVDRSAASSFVLPPDSKRQRVCQCNAGWTGERCEKEAVAEVEAKPARHEEL